MRNQNGMRLMIVVCILIWPASISMADTIFNSFGPGDSYNAGVGYTIGNGGYQQGNAFSPAMTASVDSYEIAIGLVSGQNLFSLSLLNDLAGEPGSVIETFQINDAMGTFGVMNPPILVNSLVHPLLEAGKQYWLIAGAPSADTWAAFNYNGTGMMGLRATWSDVASFWDVYEDNVAAFRINGTPGAAVPEPTSLLLLAAGIGVLGLAARRKSK